MGQPKKLPKNTEKTLNTKGLYKKPTSTFGDTNKIRADIVREVEDGRKKHRSRQFEINRETKKQPSSRNENQKKLLEWKTEREKKKNQEKVQKRPPFKVGIVHHRVYSPVTPTNVSVVQIKKKPMVQVHAKSKEVLKTGITKVTQKRLAEKAANVTKSTSLVVKTDSFQKSRDDKIEVNVKNNKSFAPSNYKFKPPILANNVLLFGKVLIEDKLSPENNLCGHDEGSENLNGNVASDTIETISLEVSSNEREVSGSLQIEERSSQGEKSMSCETSNAKQSSEISSCTTEERRDNVKEIILVSSSTEDNVRVEEEEGSLDIGRSLGSDKLSRSAEAKMKCSNVSREEQEYTVQHFKHLLHTETERLQELCEKWVKVQSQDNTVEEAQRLISQTIGQTSLLLNEKFRQFRGLVLDCERGGCVLPVNCADLHGFWDLMYIAVRDCDSRFARLEKLCASHWQEDEMKSTYTKSCLKSIARQRGKPAKEEAAQTKQNLLREFISSERRKKKTREMQERKGTASNSWLILDTFGKCITPSISNRKLKPPKRRHDMLQSGTILGKRSKSIYTSTPAHNSINSRTFHRLSTPLITMKINQLYNRCTPQLGGMVQCTAVSLTPRSDRIAKPGKPRRSISINSTPRLQRNGSLISKALYDEELANISGELETNRDAESSSKKVDNANISKLRSVERICSKKGSSCYSPSEEDSTLKWLPSTNESTEAGEENDTSASSSCDSKDAILMEQISRQDRSRRDSRAKSPVRRSKSQTMNEKVETSRATQSPANIFSTPRIARNPTPKKITLDRPDVDHVRSSKDHETSVKILRSRSISFVDTPRSIRSSRIRKQIFNKEENTVQSESRSSATSKAHSANDGI